MIKSKFVFNKCIFMRDKTELTTLFTYNWWNLGQIFLRSPNVTTAVYLVSSSKY